jgi:8-hydroxy-5-deazaflavin:NADPH oxidoreductase
MKIGVIGAGRIGANLAGQWARRGHDVVVSFKRDPEALAAVAEETGARAGSVVEAAAHGQAVVVAVPWAVLDTLAGEVDVAGKAVVDTTNQFAHGGLVELTPGVSAAEVNAQRFAGAALVKAFNTYTSGFQAAVGNGLHSRPVAMFLGGEDGRAKAVGAELVRDAGFEPVDIGGWKTIALLEAPRRPGAVYGEEYDPNAAHRIAAAATEDLAEAARLADALKTRPND